MASQYVTPESFAGKSLADLRRERTDPFRSDVLASQLGIDENAKLTAGQRLNFTGGDSAESQFLNSAFTPFADYQAQQSQNAIRNSSQQAIQTLQSGQAPLESRYQDLIKNIRQTGEQEVQRADIASAQELAKRGISTQSGYAGEYQQQRRLPIQTAFQGQEAQAQLSAQQAIENRNSAIANIQQATGLNEVNAALQAYQQAEQTRQFNEQQALSRETFAFQKEQASRPQGSPYETVAFGNNLYRFNPATGEVESVASKGSGSTPFAESDWT